MSLLIRSKVRFHISPTHVGREGWFAVTDHVRGVVANYLDYGVSMGLRDGF